MCWQCENPGATTADYLEFVRSLINRHSWAVQAVEGTRVGPPWSYTVGLTAFGAPELVVTGMSHARAAALLNEAAEHVMHSEAPPAGDRVTFPDGPRVEFVEVTNADAHLSTAIALFGPVARGLQIVWADDRGHWPWQLGFRGTRGGQPVLGIRAAA